MLNRTEQNETGRIRWDRRREEKRIEKKRREEKRIEVLYLVRILFHTVFVSTIISIIQALCICMCQMYY